LCSCVWVSFFVIAQDFTVSGKLHREHNPFTLLPYLREDLLEEYFDIESVNVVLTAEVRGTSLGKVHTTISGWMKGIYIDKWYFFCVFIRLLRIISFGTEE
jgi:hypothetical protein